MHVCAPDYYYQLIYEVMRHGALRLWLSGSHSPFRSSFYSESPLRLSTSKRSLAVGSTLSSAWAKDYREADVSVYSENLLNYVAQRM